MLVRFRVAGTAQADKHVRAPRAFFAKNRDRCAGLVFHIRMLVGIPRSAVGLRSSLARPDGSALAVP